MDLETPLTAVSQATPEWLTAVLITGNHLQTGTVTTVTYDSENSANAHNGHLTLTYSTDAAGTCPTNLFLKICIDNQLFGGTEPTFYKTIVPQIYRPPMPTPYHIAYSADTQNYHLLLDDLSSTHQNNWQLKPTLRRARQTVASIAKLHATWWDRQQLPTAGTWPTATVISRYCAYPTQGLAPMLTEMDPALTTAERNLLKQVFTQYPEALKRRAATAQHLTYIHGDLNPGNILSPLEDCGRYQTYLIDHQLFDWSLSIWLGASDLAYMMVHWWPTETRRKLERPLLQHYHHHLQELGVQNYTFADLWQDYRLCAMQSFYVVGAWCADETERHEFSWVWRPQLTKTIQACLDLQCTDLLY